MHLKTNLSRGIVVDKEDEYLLVKYLFSTSIAGYATTEIENRTVRLHRLILKVDGFVDHKNRVKLDNRRTNLRPATRNQNGYNRSKLANNTSGYIGVTRCGTSWRAQLSVNGKSVPIGTFLTKEEAAFKRDIAAKKHHGEFAKLNFDLELT